MRVIGEAQSNDAQSEPDFIKFQEEFDAGLMSMTLNAYKNLYNAYEAYRTSAPHLPTPIESQLGAVSSTMQFDRRRKRLHDAFELGEYFGRHRRPEEELHSFFRNVDPQIKSRIEQGYLRGSNLPKESLTPETSKLLFIRARAFSKGRYCDLNMTAEDLDRMVPKYCPIIGSRLVRHSGDPLHSDPAHAWSAERMANQLGYDKENIAIISTKANKARGGLTPRDILKRAAGIVQDESLTRIQWCRLLNNHWANLRLEDPYLSKLTPPITWPASRYMESDRRQVAALVANPLLEDNLRQSITPKMLAQYFSETWGEAKKIGAASSFLKTTSLKHLALQSHLSVNLLETFLVSGNIKMLDQLSKDISPESKSTEKTISSTERQLIIRASDLRTPKVG